MNKNEFKKLVIDNNIIGLIELELARASALHGEFNSAHEGYAVLLEEKDELKYEYDSLDKIHSQLWRAIMSNNKIEALDCLKELELYSKNVVNEGIQVAAMIKKLKNFYEEVK